MLQTRLHLTFAFSKCFVKRVYNKHTQIKSNQIKSKPIPIKNSQNNSQLSSHGVDQEPPGLWPQFLHRFTGSQVKYCMQVFKKSPMCSSYVVFFQPSTVMTTGSSSCVVGEMTLVFRRSSRSSAAWSHFRG